MTTKCLLWKRCIEKEASAFKSKHPMSSAAAVCRVICTGVDLPLKWLENNKRDNLSVKWTLSHSHCIKSQFDNYIRYIRGVMFTCSFSTLIHLIQSVLYTPTHTHTHTFKHTLKTAFDLKIALKCYKTASMSKWTEIKYPVNWWKQHNLEFLFLWQMTAGK